MELTILRPTLIYGAGNPGNLYRLLKLVKIGIPLPFGSIRDKRSLLNVSNFADVIARVVIAPNAANRVFLVSDGEDISTSQLVRSLGVSVGRRVVLFPFPKSILRLLAAAFGKTRDMEKILGSFQVDNSLLRDALGLQIVSTKGCLEKNRIG
jgi:nucleoside-diphosphate-sugar epimerase